MTGKALYSTSCSAVCFKFSVLFSLSVGKQAVQSSDHETLGSVFTFGIKIVPVYPDGS